MITAQRQIKAFMPKLAPIKIAAACYQKWEGTVNFIDDLDDYMLTGVVISTPYLFGMAKIIDVANGREGETVKPEPAWFVRMASLPCYLPKICFCRRGDGRLRVYDTARLVKLAGVWHRRPTKTED